MPQKKPCFTRSFLPAPRFWAIRVVMAWPMFCCGHIGKVVNAAGGGKGSHGVDTHGVHDGLHGDLAQLHGGLLHGAGPAVADGLAQQRAVKHQPAPAQLQDRDLPADIDHAEHAAQCLAQHGGKGAALAAPVQHLTKNRSPPMFSTELIIRKYRALLLSPSARMVAARKL